MYKAPTMPSSHQTLRRTEAELEKDELVLHQISFSPPSPFSSALISPNLVVTPPRRIQERHRRKLSSNYPE